MRIIVDAGYFQFLPPLSGAASTCERLLQQVLLKARERGVSVVVLDRGGLPDLGCETVRSFPSYRRTAAATDAILVQRLCDWLGADVFISTCLTIPLTVPTLQLLLESSIDDHQLGQSNQMESREQEIALAFSSHVICPAKEMRDSLLSRFPDLELSTVVTFADTAVGNVPEDDDIAARIINLAINAPAVFTESWPLERRSRWVDLRRMQSAVEV